MVPSAQTLIKLVMPRRKALSAAAVCMGISAIATAGYAYLIGPVLRFVFMGQEQSGFAPAVGILGQLSQWIAAAQTWQLGALLVALAFIKGAAFFGQTVLSAWAGQRVLRDLRVRLYEGLLGLNPLNPLVRARGDLSVRFTVDVEAVEVSITKGLVAFLRDGLQIMALAGLALALDPCLGLVGLVAFPPAALLIIRIGRRLRKRRKAVHSAFGKLSDTVDETAAGLSVIRAFKAGAMMGKRFEKRTDTVLSSTMKAIITRAISSPINELMGAAALALTLWYAGARIGEGTLSPEAFVSFFSALFLLYQPVKGIGQAQHNVQAGLAALGRLESLGGLDLNKSCRADSSNEKSTGHPSSIKLNNIKAGYGDGPNVLENLSLTIEPGKHTAVVGHSGAGKTTLLNLLQGLLPLRDGELLVDDQQVELEQYSHLFAPVYQEPFLFDDSIRMNVLCGRPGATDEEVMGACEAAGLGQVIKKLPNGLENRVGRDGAQLSVGQRQRVCLARALICRAPVLLLDEVTAALDGQTEFDLVQRLGDYLKGRTALVVTHRMATARWADTVALLDGGRVDSAGPSDQMLENDKLRRLFGRSQAAQEEKDNE